MKWIVSLSLLISSLAWADGHSVNNGGGVICINGQCKTLVEAGLEVKPEYQCIWLPDEKVLVKAREIIGALPFETTIREKLEQQIIGRLNQFRKATVVDPQKLDAIKQLYLKMATDAGFPIDPATFQLVAFSSDNTVQPAMTYILQKFADLTTEQQAYLLIHEGLYRGQPTNRLRYILQFENAIQNECSLEKKLNAYFAAYHLELITKSELLGYMLFAAGVDPSQHTCDFFAHSIDPSNIGTVNLSKDGTTVRLSFEWERILDLGQRDSRIPYIFSQIDGLDFKVIRKEPRSGSYSQRLNLDEGVFRLFLWNSEYIEAELMGGDSLPLLLPD